SIAGRSSALAALTDRDGTSDRRSSSASHAVWSDPCNAGMIGQESDLSATITFTCAGPLAFWTGPFAHGNLDDIAQRRDVAGHFVQQGDAFRDAEIETSKGADVGRQIEHAFGLGAPEHRVDGALDAGGSLGDSAKHFVRRVRKFERGIGVEAAARTARLAQVR